MQLREYMSTDKRLNWRLEVPTKSRLQPRMIIPTKSWRQTTTTTTTIVNIRVDQGGRTITLHGLFRSILAFLHPTSCGIIGAFVRSRNIKIRLQISTAAPLGTGLEVILITRRGVSEKRFQEISPSIRVLEATILTFHNKIFRSQPRNQRNLLHTDTPWNEQKNEISQKVNKARQHYTFGKRKMSQIGHYISQIKKATADFFEWLDWFPKKHYRFFIGGKCDWSMDTFVLRLTNSSCKKQSAAWWP